MSSDLFKFKYFKSGQTVGDDKSPAKPGLLKPPLRVSLSSETFDKLREYIYMQCGIYFTDSKKYLLESRILKRLQERNIPNFEEYLSFLQSFNGRQELNDLFEAITINETYFFRAEQQFESLEKIIIPEIMEGKKGLPRPVFRIWSAASSSGEEAYTIAIIILETLQKKYPNVQFQILASDINKAVLDNARKGVFREYAIRNIPKPVLNKYFTQNGSNFILNDEVKRMVKFMQINLYDEMAMRSIVNCDVIFCCNVLIYFDIPSKQKVVSYLYNSLSRGGYMFIGYSESLHGVSKAFKLVHLPKAMAYKKE